MQLLLGQDLGEDLPLHDKHLLPQMGRKQIGEQLAAEVLLTWRAVESKDDESGFLLRFRGLSFLFLLAGAGRREEQSQRQSPEDRTWLRE